MNLFRHKTPVTIVGMLVISFASLMAAHNTPVSALSLSRCANVEVLAHRGVWDNSHTENTMRSFRQAADDNIGIVETDIRKTSDNEWVFMHDVTVSRTTNGDGAVGKQTLAQIKKYKTTDGVVGGVPSLGEGFIFLQNHPNIQMDMEFKTYPISDAAVKEVVDRTIKHDLLSRVRFTSFDPGVLLQIQKLVPEATVGLISEDQVPADTAAKFDNKVYIERSKATGDYIDRMHKSGVKVGTWMVDTNSEWRSTILNGADAVTSDAAPSIKRYCNNS